MNTEKLSQDMEEKLERVILVHSPHFNMVFRQAICRCRLAGDSSPSAPDIDLPMMDYACRLHAPDGVISKHKTKITQPDDGYDPRNDHYFARFGGYLAFALYIIRLPIVYHSVSISKLPDLDKELDEAGERLKEALANEACNVALKNYEEELAYSYFNWRREHVKEADRRRAERDNPKPIRRGSF